MEFYRETAADALRWHVDGEGVNSFKHLLIERFSSQERKEQWQLELYGVKQLTVLGVKITQNTIGGYL